MPGTNDNSSESSEGMINGLYDRYPRLARVLASFKQNPLSGNTLRMMVKGEEEITRDMKQVRALEPPVMWEQSAPVVISQYGGYGSETLPTYWNTVLPDVQQRYGAITRYEHHDTPVPERSLMEYKLATAGRAIQDQAGNQAFWTWFNAIMVDGVTTMDEALQLIGENNLAADREYVEDAIQYDVYGEVIWNDIQAALGKADEEAAEEMQELLENGESVFAVFVNGIHVQPSYDSIVGVIEDIRSVQNGQQANSTEG